MEKITNQELRRVVLAIADQRRAEGKPAEDYNAELLETLADRIDSLEYDLRRAERRAPTFAEMDNVLALKDAQIKEMVAYCAECKAKMEQEKLVLKQRISRMRGDIMQALGKLAGVHPALAQVIVEALAEEISND